MKKAKATLAVLLSTSLLFGCTQEKEEIKPADDNAKETSASASALDDVSSEYGNMRLVK